MRLPGHPDGRSLGLVISKTATWIQAIDKQLAARIPEYGELANPALPAVKDAQARLRPDEAVVQFLDAPKASPTPEEAFIWVVTKTDVRWVCSDPGTAALTREVKALRRGLDRDVVNAGQYCAKLQGASGTETDANCTT